MLSRPHYQGRKLNKNLRQLAHLALKMIRSPYLTTDEDRSDYYKNYRTIYTFSDPGHLLDDEIYFLLADQALQDLRAHIPQLDSPKLIKRFFQGHIHEQLYAGTTPPLTDGSSDDEEVRPGF